LPFDRFDLSQDGIGGLVVAPDRYAFAAAGISAIAYCCNDDLRLSSAAAGNPKSFPERPGFFVGGN